MTDVSVDATRCAGSGNCAYWAPDVFDVGDDGVAVIIGDPGAATEAVALAADHCPTRAITARRLPD